MSRSAIQNNTTIGDIFLVTIDIVHVVKTSDEAPVRRIPAPCPIVKQ